ncbi:hypothetical protein, partial [Pseudomonas sp.]|uniref:hypothetical protein n=1 Tax=Pseudomonas sp. TaxID=306 RepID=UPI002FC94A94
TCVADASLKTGSKCSFTTRKLRFFACFCLASAASPTFFNGLLIGGAGKICRLALNQGRCQAGSRRVFSGEVSVVKENVAAWQALQGVPSLSSCGKCDQRVADVAITMEQAF